MNRRMTNTHVSVPVPVPVSVPVPVPDPASEFIERFKAWFMEAKALGISIDGHAVGGPGERIAAEWLGLTLAPDSTKGWNALDSSGRKVEIKATTRRTFTLSGNVPVAQRLVCIRFGTEGDPVIEYDGPYLPVWEVSGGRVGAKQRTVGLGVVRSIASEHRIWAGSVVRVR